MEELAITPLTALDKLSSTYFRNEKEPGPYIIKLAQNFKGAHLEMPEGTNKELSSWSLIKCHTAWLWYCSKTDATEALKYYKKLIRYIYDRGNENSKLQLPAMRATNDNEYWRSIGGTNNDKRNIVQEALTVTIMFKGEPQSGPEQKLWEGRLAELLQEKTG